MHRDAKRTVLFAQCSGHLSRRRLDLMFGRMHTQAVKMRGLRRAPSAQEQNAKERAPLQPRGVGTLLRLALTMAGNVHGML